MKEELLVFHTIKNVLPTHCVRLIVIGWMLILVFGTTVLHALPHVDRIDLFDKADNRLMFVTFHYDANDKNTSRCVYMADSTFVDSMAIVSTTKELVLNFNGDTTGTTTISSTGTSTSFSVFDIFPLPGQLDWLGAPVSYSGSAGTYELSQRGKPIYKMRYSTESSGNLKIEVLDNSGSLLYYATCKSDSIPIRQRSAPFFKQQAVRMLGSGKYLTTVNISYPSLVKLELYQLSGRLATVLLKTKLEPGRHTLTAVIPHSMADNLYITRLSVDGENVIGQINPRFAESAAILNAAEIVPPRLIYELLLRNGDLESERKIKYYSPTTIAISTDKSKLYIAEQTAKRIAIMSLSTNSITNEFLLPNEPTGIASDTSGTTLYVTCSSERWPAGVVCVIDAASGKIKKMISAGHGARSPVLSPDGTKLYVCNTGEHTVMALDVVSYRETARIQLIREPYAAAISPDGLKLFVTNSLPEGTATDSNITGKISVINTTTNTVSSVVSLPAGSHSIFSICISSDGKYAFCPHLIGRFLNSPDRITQGWIHTNNLGIIDVTKGTLVNDVDLDNASLGRANPWVVATSTDNKFLCIVHAGSNELSIIDLSALIKKATSGVDLHLEFTSLSGIQKSITLASVGGRSIAIAGNKAYIAGYFSDKIDRIDLSNAIIETTIPLGTIKPANAERSGMRNFCDGRLCVQNWQSCVSCHPFTRPDALNWILTGGNNFPKNAKNMLYAAWTPPTQWKGTRPGIFGSAGSVRMGMLNELGVEPNEEAAITIDTMLLWLKPVPSPYLVKGRLSASAQRGKLIFSKAECSYCHPSPLFTDGQKSSTYSPHGKVFFDSYGDNAGQWDTPTLIECWRTSPYGHLGSYIKMEDFIRLRDHSDYASKLSETSQDFKDLIEYVLSL